jgi:outer membrane protein, heavy metal efflux system
VSLAPARGGGAPRETARRRVEGGGLRRGLAALAALLWAGPVLAVGSSAPSIPAPPSLVGKVTLPETLKVLEERSLDVVAADLAVMTAAAQVKTAGAVPNPALGFSIGRSWLCDSAGCDSPVLAGSLGDQGALAFLVTGQRGLAVGAAEQGLRAAEAARADVLRNAIYVLKKAYADASMARRAVEFSQEEEKAAGEVLARARERRARGELSESDVSRLEVLQLQLQQLVDRARQADRQAHAALAQVLGVRGASVAAFFVDGSEVASARVPPRLEGATLEGLTASALRDRPDVVASRAQVEQGRLASELARRLVIPQFSLQLGYTMQGNSTGWFTPPTGTVGISVPIPAFYQQQGQIQAADAASLGAQVALARAEVAVTAEVATAWAGMTAARSSAERAEGQLLERSRASRDLLVEEHRRGDATMLEVLDAHRTLLRIELDYLQTLGEYWGAVFELEKAVGGTFHP